MVGGNSFEIGCMKDRTSVHIHQVIINYGRYNVLPDKDYIQEEGELWLIWGRVVVQLVFMK